MLSLERRWHEAAGLYSTKLIRERDMRGFLLSLFWLLAGPAVAQEKFVGSFMDSRLIVDFKVSDAAVQKLLPPGWEIDAALLGTSVGANLRLVFIDQIAAHNSSGKPLVPTQNLVIYIPSRKTGSEAHGLITSSYVTSRGGGGVGPYGAATIAANFTVERKFHHEPAGITTVDESWEYLANSGDSISLQARYIRGIATREKVDARIYSPIKPDFFRIYRYEQGSDIVRSSAVGTERLQKFTYKISGELLSPLLDGTEQLISLISVPWQQRDVFLPGT